MSLRLVWRAWFRRRRFEAELGEELAFHLAARRDDLIAAGLDPAAAERRARLELGMVESHKDDCRRARGLDWREALAGDLRYAARGLWRDRGFTLTALLVLGLAIGVNAVLLTFVRAYVVGGLESQPGGGWVDVEARQGDGDSRARFTRAEMAILESAGEGVLEGLYGLAEVRAVVADPGTPVAYGRAVSARYFTWLGAQPRLGRTFAASEDEVASEPPPLVLSEPGWRRLTGSDPDIVGRPLTLSGTTFVVTGVLPRGVHGLEPVVPQFWIPLSAHEAMRRRAGNAEPRYLVGGVLRPSIPVERAAAALDRARATLDEIASAGESLAEVRVSRRRGLLASVDAAALAPAAGLTGAAFVLVLLVGCANLANLSLSRAAARRREIAVRLSLGAGRGRVVRQFLTESLLLSVLGAAIALLAAVAGVALLQRFVFAGFVALGIDVTPIAPDVWVVGGALLLAVLSALVFGLAPALEVTTEGLSAVGRRDEARLAGRVRPARLRRGLVVAQVAVSLVLLVAAALIVVNSRRAGDVEIGFDPSRVIDVGFERPSAALERRLELVPGVGGVTAVSQAPLYGGLERRGFRVGGEVQALGTRAVDHRFFETLRVPIERGRGFARAEAEGQARAVVVSAATARRLWPGQDPLGRTLELVPEPDDATSPAGAHEVVGVAADVVSGWFFQGHDPSAVYLPVALGSPRVGDLVLRVDGDVRAALAGVRAACAAVDPTAICDPSPLARILALQRVPFTVASDVAGGLGLAAVFISCIGLYGVVGFQVAQHRREMGVRLALGSSPARLVRHVLAGAGRAIALGLALGLPVCVGLSWLLRAAIPTVQAFDPRAYLAVPVTLAAVTLGAALMPALRAGRLDPVVALREE